jgi:hypothetical protein
MAEVAAPMPNMLAPARKDRRFNTLSTAFSSMLEIAMLVLSLFR